MFCCYKQKAECPGITPGSPQLEPCASLARFSSQRALPCSGLGRTLNHKGADEMCCLVNPTTPEFPSSGATDPAVHRALWLMCVPHSGPCLSPLGGQGDPEAGRGPILPTPGQGPQNSVSGTPAHRRATPHPGGFLGPNELRRGKFV